MANRIPQEQLEHDLVVKKSALTFIREGGTAKTNPGTEKNFEVDGNYPDVFAQEKSGLKVIEEIEIANTVTEDECQRQWKQYSQLPFKFNLIVPSDKMGVAQRIVRKFSLSVNLQGYSIMGDGVQFYDAQGRPTIRI